MRRLKNLLKATQLSGYGSNNSDPVSSPLEPLVRPSWVGRKYWAFVEQGERKAEKGEGQDSMLRKTVTPWP